MSDQSFRISTTLSKVPDAPTVFDFVVECRLIGEDGEVSQAEAIGKLEGFLADPGYLPEDHEDWYFDIFDMRSGHAAEAFDILVEHRALIESALPNSDLLEMGSGVAMLERASINPQYRGKGLALRLMREALHVIGRHGLLVILKAHPDGEDVGTSQLLRLADYYASDKWLGLRHLSMTQLPGWLVAHWDEANVTKGDEAYWHDD